MNAASGEEECCELAAGGAAGDGAICERARGGAVVNENGSVPSSRPASAAPGPGPLRAAASPRLATRCARFWPRAALRARGARFRLRLAIVSLWPLDAREAACAQGVGVVRLGAREQRRNLGGRHGDGEAARAVLVDAALEHGLECLE